MGREVHHIIRATSGEGQQFDVLTNHYLWQPMPPGQPPARNAITCVRDGDVWHQFVAASPHSAAQRYRVASFHFKEGTDAAGFVAWLGGHPKRSAGGCRTLALSTFHATSQ
jgi:hypothetical protein